MATKKTGLGRGLEALLGPSATPATPAPPPDAAPAAAEVPATGLRELDLDQLTPGEYQPRRDMHRETLQELAASIKQEGVLQPISVRALQTAATGQPRYEIIAGERRWRAAQLAGLAKIPAIVREVDDEQAAAIALIENLQREDLNPLEEARGLQRLIDEFELTHQEAATAVGKSRATVTNLLRLLELAPEALQLLAGGQLSMGHARALLGLSGARSQAAAAQDVVAKGLSVRQTEALVKRLQAGKPASGAARPAQIDPDTRRLQLDLAERLGAKVALQHTAAGKGKLIISYNSLDELDGILAHIK
jgi:ParB family chromosome partitioning protein